MTSSSAAPGGVGLVLVEFQYDYKGRDGVTVSIRPNERYVLLAKTNDHWWHVRKDDRAKPFYIPAKYVKELPELLPSPLDFADPPGAEPVAVPTPASVPVPVPVPKPAAVEKPEEAAAAAAGATRPGDEVRIRVRPQQNRHQKTENRMSTFGVPLEFNDPPPPAPPPSSAAKRADPHHLHVLHPPAGATPTPLAAPGEGGLAKRRPSLVKAPEPHHPPAPPQPRVPSFSPADPVARPGSTPRPVEPPSVPELRREKETGSRSALPPPAAAGAAAGGGGGGGGGKEDKGLNASLNPEAEEEEEEEEEEEVKVVTKETEEARDESGDNIYETIMDLNLDLSSMAALVEAACNATGPPSGGGPGGLGAPAAPPATPTTTATLPPQNALASPNTAVYANVNNLKKNAPQPPTVSISSPTSPSPVSPASPTSPAPSSGPASPLSPREGWQVHTDKDSGKEFYHNPSTGKTTWSNPSGDGIDQSKGKGEGLLSQSPGHSPAASSKHPQGLIWEQLMDETTGKFYYYNPTTRDTAWDAPEPGTPSPPGPRSGPGSGPGLGSGSGSGPGIVPLSGMEAASGQKKHQEGGPPPLPEEDYPLTDSPAADSQPPRGPPPTLPKRTASIPRAMLEGGGPDGWSRSTNTEGKAVFTSERTQEKWIKSEDERGKTYYYQKDGTKSQWNLPELPGPPSLPHVPGLPHLPNLPHHPGAPSLPHPPGASGLPRLGNGLDLEAPSTPPSWRQTLGPAQFGPATEENRFFPSHRRNFSDFGEASSSGNSPETPHHHDRFRVRRLLSNQSTDSHHQQHLEKAGLLNKTKIADHGKRIRKNWGQSWTVLHGGILTFHRDPKSAPASNSNKSNQIVPEYTVELKGAVLAWAPKDKSSKKNVLELKTRQGCEYLIQYDTESIIYDWHKVLYETIRQLEKEHLSEEEEEEVLQAEKSPNPSDKEDKEKRRISSRIPSVTAPESEQGRVRTKLRKFLQRRPTLQAVKEKGYIRDSVFGCHLDTLCHRENSTIPKFLEKCIRAVERRGLEVDGIYRVSGNLAVIQRLRHKADHEEDLDLEDGQWEEVHVITGALKLFLRELPEPLFPFSFFEKFIAAIKVSDYPQKVSYFRDLVRSLPLPNHDTMEQLFKHLRKVIEYGEANRMSVQSVAIVFGPTLLRPQTESANITMHMVFQNQIVELILNEFLTVFPPS